jgi:hypothetical protein
MENIMIEWLDIISLLLVAIGLFYSGRQLQLSNKVRADSLLVHKASLEIHKDNHDWNRRVNSLRFSFADDPKLIELLERMDLYFEINSKFPEEIRLSKMEEKKIEYPSVFNDIHFSLARLEAMCIAIKNGVADEKICKSLLKTRVITFNRMFRQYIEHARDKRKTKELFINLENYAEKWKANEISDRQKTVDVG